MIRRFAPPLIAVLVLVVTLAGGATPARADASVDASSIEPQYPKTLNFKITASAPADITDVRLIYAIAGRGASAIATPDDITKGKTVSVTVAVQTNSGSSYIAPGSDFSYHWEIATADGKTTATKDQQYRYLPPGKDWQSVSNDFMQVLYYGDRKALADTYLKAGQETFDKIGKQLLNTQLKITPVKVLLFPVESELEQAKPGAGGGRFDAAVTTCGTKVTDDIVFVIPQACGSNDRTDTLRHEFGHIINAAAGEGTLAKLPSWLDEGTAVYAQTDPGSNYISAFLSALRANRLLPFTSMGVATSTASQVNLFYGQSYGMVKYLIDKGGPAKYAEFFATIKKGSRFDQALQQVYGFDLAGFEQEFTTNGGQVRGAGSSQSGPTVAPTQAPPRQVSPTAVAATQRPRAATSPTIAPTPAPAVKSNGADDKSLSTETIAIVGAAVVFALLAVLAFLVSIMLQNNRTHGGGPTASPPDAN